MGIAPIFFQPHRLMHTTVMVLNFTRERIPSEEQDGSCVFLVTWDFSPTLFSLHGFSNPEIQLLVTFL